MVIAFIDAHRDQFGVGPACTVLREHGARKVWLQLRREHVPSRGARSSG